MWLQNHRQEDSHFQIFTHQLQEWLSQIWGQESSITYWCQDTAYYVIIICNCCIWRMFLEQKRISVSVSWPSRYHKIPLVREHQADVPKSHHCSHSNSNDRHPLTSLVQQREPKREKTIVHVPPLCKQEHHPGEAKFQIKINILYTFAAQGRLGGWGTYIHTSQDENYHKQMYYASQILVSHLKHTMLVHLFYAFNELFIYMPCSCQ